MKKEVIYGAVCDLDSNDWINGVFLCVLGGNVENGTKKDQILYLSIQGMQNLIIYLLKPIFLHLFLLMIIIFFP